MRPYLVILVFVFYTALSSFTVNKACEYMGSNIGYIQKQTRKALDAPDLNTSRYYAYKALNAIEKSKEQFLACGCELAQQSIIESLDHLKRATRVSSLTGTRLILEKALAGVESSLQTLEEHEEVHQSQYGSDQLSLNTRASYMEELKGKIPVGKALEKKIDQALVNYQNSLDQVVNTIPCKEAYQLALKNYERCEEQLLRPELTEAKKYYNLRTKEITALALEKLRECATSIP
ncbi:hypothetical protein [Lentiprolixibacter aurantiacus]|uniref:Uncharacterized protein n=1 Tax=Lentiprolixibacter aurantiacus TaxID=2993939 RepID=A0AAE3MN79_9FLAO|nr:hypothetical protein [Lentiprolixibacter aurantiacus]MCX2720514.1 hypothetical protein [Lentiprolixibacter aurantiacus]